MLARIRGKVVLKTKDRIYLDVGGLVYEVFLPRIVHNRIKNMDRQELELIVFHYLVNEKTLSRPFLIGFLSDLEKEFFELFISVSGIGPKAALKALDKPISLIAEAIEKQNVNFLKKLPGIGARKAYQILGKLSGKVARFLLIPDKGFEVSEKEEKNIQHEEIIEEALQILLQLQYSRTEAKSLIKKVLERNKNITTVEELLNEIYRSKR